LPAASPVVAFRRLTSSGLPSPGAINGAKWHAQHRPRCLNLAARCRSTSWAAASTASAQTRWQRCPLPLLPPRGALGPRLQAASVAGFSRASSLVAVPSHRGGSSSATGGRVVQIDRLRHHAPLLAWSPQQCRRGRRRGTPCHRIQALTQSVNKDDMSSFLVAAWVVPPLFLSSSEHIHSKKDTLQFRA
jgi:hypothetical protein